MANHYFQFKQFRVEQNLCTMNVSSDACIQGALASLHLNAPLNILDIGTGTGVLSLMMAQSFEMAKISAIDINRDAVSQANCNFQISQWHNRLQAYHISLQEFCNQHNPQSFDAIICNPPFFSNHLCNNSQQKTLARHDIALNKKELAQAVQQLLTPNGQFCVMYPFPEWSNWVLEAQASGLYIKKQFDIYQKTNKPANRVIAILSKYKTPTIYHSFYLRNENDEFTDEYNSLVNDWYL